MTTDAPVSINLHDGYGTVRMKRHVNTGHYENAELEVDLPCPLDQVGATIEALFLIMENFQDEARKRFRYQPRYSSYSDDEEEDADK